VRRKQLIEKEYGKPLAEVLLEEYQSLGSVEKLAKKLSVSKGSIAYYAAREGLEFKTVLVRREHGAIAAEVSHE
jgi:hypothetical protein